MAIKVIKKLKETGKILIVNEDDLVSTSVEQDIIDLQNNKADKIFNNLSATVDPTVNNDTTEGYKSLSIWFNTSSSEIFKCIDATEGAAIWVKTSLTIDELGSMASVNDATSDGKIYGRKDGTWEEIMQESIFLEKVLYVSKNGNDTSGDGSINKPYLTIQKAIDNSTTGYLINIAPGTYIEDLLLKSGVSLNAESQYSVIIQGVNNYAGVNSGTSIYNNISFISGVSGNTFYISSTGAYNLIFNKCSISNSTYYDGVLFSSSSFLINGTNILGKISFNDSILTNTNTENLAPVLECQSSIILLLNNTTIKHADIDGQSISISAGNYYHTGGIIEGARYISGTANAVFNFMSVTTNSVAVLNHTSSGIVSENRLVINTSASPAILGTGTLVGSLIAYAGTGSGVQSTVNASTLPLAPIRLRSGLYTTPLNGLLEYDSNKFYGTIGGSRYSLVENPDWYKYKIVTSVNSGNLTVALKNYLGQDPSVAVPVKVQIGDTIRTITSALSLTLLAGSNQLNLGSSELATKEVDLFTYLWVNNLGNIQIGISRIPYGIKYSDFSLLGYNEKYLTEFIGNTTGTNPVVNIGRFNVILSGSNWSIPATSVIINRPIYETRELSFNSTTTVDNGQTLSGISNVSTYKIIGNQLLIKYRINWTSVSGTCYAITTTKPFQDNYGHFSFISVGDYYSADGHKLTQIYNNGGVDIYRTNQDGGALNTGSGSINENLILTI